MSTESTLHEILAILKRIDSRTAVNTELIQTNLKLNEACNATEIVPLPPLKLESKIKIAAKPLSEASVLLVGKTFDIRNLMKDSVPLSFTSTPEKGWVCNKENLPKLQKDLNEVAEIVISECAPTPAPTQAPTPPPNTHRQSQEEEPSVHSVFNLS